MFLSSPGRRRTEAVMLARLLVLLFCAVVLLAGLTTGDLLRNEGLRARLAAEALATNNWLVPTLYGQPHLTKPPGMSVLIGLCSLPAGQVTAVTARLPSVLAGAVVLLAWGLTFRRLCGSPYGFMQAAILPCSWLWLDRVPSAEIDLVQLAWVSGALLCLLRAVEVSEEEEIDNCKLQISNCKLEEGTAQCPSREGNRVTFRFNLQLSFCNWQLAIASVFNLFLLPLRRSWPWWLAALFCVAGGLFTKWTAPAFFYLTAVPFLYARGRLHLLFRAPHLTAALLVAALALGWLALVGQSAGWRSLLDTLSREALLRLSPAHHPRPYPWDELATFPLSFVAGCLPWSLLALLTLAPAFRAGLDDRQRRLWQLCQCWLWVNLLFWTVVPGHRPRHVLPIQPAVAALAGLAWFAWTSGRLRWSWPRCRPWPILVCLVAGWLVVKLLFVGVVLPRRQTHRQPRLGGEQLARLVPSGQTLYLFRVKDEGVLFYYGRPARRLPGPERLPAGAWCLLTEAEWSAWPVDLPARRQGGVRDGQGAALVLVRRARHLSRGSPPRMLPEQCSKRFGLLSRPRQDPHHEP
jgi:4-amino-4-deoxy-L-arabinose transferase-like glycosyltransferase